MRCTEVPALLYMILSPKLQRHFEIFSAGVDITFSVHVFSNKQVRDCSVTGEASSILALRVHATFSSENDIKILLRRSSAAPRYPTCILLFSTRRGLYYSSGRLLKQRLRRRWKLLEQLPYSYLADVVFLLRGGGEGKLFYKFIFSARAYTHT